MEVRHKTWMNSSAMSGCSESVDLGFGRSLALDVNYTTVETRRLQENLVNIINDNVLTP